MVKMAKKDVNDLGVGSQQLIKSLVLSEHERVGNKSGESTNPTASTRNNPATSTNNVDIELGNNENNESIKSINIQKRRNSMSAVSSMTLHPGAMLRRAIADDANDLDGVMPLENELTIEEEIRMVTESMAVDDDTKKIQKQAILAGMLIKCVVYGGMDGGITTISVVGAIYGAGLGIKEVLIIGIVSVIVDGLSMGICDIISSDGEESFYRSNFEKLERGIKERGPRSYLMRLIELFTSVKQFDYKDSLVMVATLSKYPDELKKVIFEEDMGLSAPQLDITIKDMLMDGLATFGSFAGFGMVPLSVYLIAWMVMASDANKHLDLLFILSVILSSISMFVLGIFRAHCTREAKFATGVKMMAVGFGATALSVGLGYFFFYLLGME